MRSWIFLIIVILCCSSVFAIAISPGRTTLEFRPGLEEEVGFSIANSEGKEVNLVIAAQGELEDSVFIEEKSVKILPGEDMKRVSYNVRLPQELNPGVHTAEVVVLQLPEAGSLGETFIGAAVAVITQLHVNVPYPGKYAEADLNILAPDSEGKMQFVIPVYNRGEFDLVSVRATIDIYTSLNEKVATIETDRVGIVSDLRKDLVAVWDARAASGAYKAVVTVIYDESTLEVEKDFNVGLRKLRLENIEVNDFSLGDIAKFEVLVANEWGENVEGVYAEMEIYNERGGMIADFKSPTYDISSLEKILMTAFWDTKGVREETYDSTLFLRYGDSAEQQDLQLDVRDDEILIVGFGYNISPTGGESGLVKVLIGLVVVLVLANVSWFVYLRKRLKGGGKK